MKWYFVHTYSGYEQKAKLSLEETIRNRGLQQYFGEILIPTESVVETVKNQKRTSARKFFPSYMLVEMQLTEETWHCIKDTPKITGFVGNSTNPPPVPEHEISRLKRQIEDGVAKPKPKVSFEEGETVRVMNGPFSNFTGTVEEVKADKGRVVVSVSIFGRSTPIELDFSQVEKE
ncbi:MAG: transcription termination/antitermination protein NusG [Myxococcales bacterium]|nr:MAG: transcription termination/antitermination protein NusG [Myxococcales bacterium]